MEASLNSTQLWQHIESLKGLILWWVWWLLSIIMPVALLLLVLKGTEASLFLAKYGVPQPNDVMPWLYLAAIFYLLRGKAP